MHAFLIIIAVLALLLVWGIFRLWKKSNKAISCGSDAMLLGPDSAEERPNYQSIETDWPTAIETPAGLIDAVTINFSQSNAFIRCTNPLPVGSIFSLKIYVPDKVPIDTKAKVVWTNVNVPEDRVVNRGMGIMFIKENAKAVQ